MSLLFCTSFSGASLSAHSLIHGRTSSIWTVASTRRGRALQSPTVCPGQCSLRAPRSLGILLVCNKIVFSVNLYSVLIFFFPYPFYVCLDNFICRF